MSDWLSPTLEFILTGLKIAGVIGAFIGLSGETVHGPKARLRRVWAYGFLAVAIGAELCDSSSSELIRESRRSGSAPCPSLGHNQSDSPLCRRLKRRSS